MISDGQKWHYLVVKDLSRLLRGITCNHKEDFYCLNCSHSYRAKNKLEAHKKICENHDYCHAEMPTKNTNIIKYNHGEKSMKSPFITINKKYAIYVKKNLIIMIKRIIK